MGRGRIISEVTSPAEARKVEETVKTGYAEPILESLLNWIGVEEDLASSYERLGGGGGSHNRPGFQELAREAKKNAELLDGIRKSVDALNATQERRVEALKKME